MIAKRFYIYVVLSLLIIISILAGCQTAHINITADGTPLLNHINRLHNPKTEITATAIFVRQFLHTEGKESVIMPEYLPLGENYLVESLSKTKKLLMTIHVHNPRKVKYEMWEIHELWYPYTEWPTYMQRCFYSSRISIKNYRVDLPLDSVVKVKSKIEIRDPETKQALISIGNAIYELEGSVDRHKHKRLPAP